MICKFCGTEMDEDALFCLKCGKKIEQFSEQNSEETKKCPKCGAMVASDDRFCLKCGYSMKTRRKKKPIGLIAVIAVVILLVAGGGTAFYVHQKLEREAYEAALAAERQRQAEIQAFQEKSIELFDAINASKANFNIMSTMYSASTEMNTGLLGPSFFTSYVEGLCSGELSEEKNRKREIDKLYDSWKELECNEEEIKELRNVIDNYYFSYSDRYSLLVEGDFSIYTFDSEEKASSSDFSSKYSEAQNEIDNIDKEQWNDSNDENIQGGSTL